MDIKALIYMLNNASPSELELVRNALNGIIPETKKLDPPDYSKYSDTPWLEGLSDKEKEKIIPTKQLKEFWFRQLLKEHIISSHDDKIIYIDERIKLINRTSQNPFMVLKYKEIEDIVKNRYEQYKETYKRIRDKYILQCRNDHVKMSRFEENNRGLIDELTRILINVEIILFNQIKEL